MSAQGTVPAPDPIELQDLSPALRRQVRGFHIAAPLLLESGWFPMPLPFAQKVWPPSGLTGKSPEAIQAGQSVDSWGKAIAPLLVDDSFSGHNTAVRIPKNVIVLDVDDYPDEGKHGWQSLRTFATTHGLGDPAESLPPTIRVTPRGFKGRSGHRFFRIPESHLDEHGSTLRLGLPSEPAPHVDTLHFGHRYSMEAGSVHPDGYVYRAYDERSVRPSKALELGLATISPEDLPELPVPWLEALLSVSRSRPAADGSAPATDDDRAEAHDLLNHWLEEHSSVEVDLQRTELLERLSPSARGAIMEFDSPSRNNSNVSAACLSLLATLIEDVGHHSEKGKKKRLPLLAAIDLARDLYVRNGNRADRPREFDRALAWAFPIAEQSVLTKSQSETMQWANRIVEDEFWGQTEVLRSARDFARSRLVSPDAMLACALVIVASWLPPHLTLPGFVGGESSLNFYVALAAASGGGKSSSMSAAKEWLKVTPHEDSTLETDTPLVTTIATGEGLLSAFTTTIPRPKGESLRPGQLNFIQHRRSVRFEIDEIQSLGAAMSRESSTLRGFLKQMWTGSAPSTLAADATRTRMLDDHSFRATVIAGVQPGTADVLLSDTAGGFPQRWLWVDTFDEGKLSIDELDKQMEAPPEPLDWTPPRAAYPLPVPEEAEPDEKKAFINARRAALSFTDGPHEVLEVTRSIRLKVVAAAQGGRKLGDMSHTMEEKLDRHGVLLEEKLAALLAALHGHVGIKDQHERMAEWLKAKSDATRSAILKERNEEDREIQDAKAVRQGKSAAIADEVQHLTVEERLTERIMSRILDSDGSIPFRALRRQLNLDRYITGAEAQMEFLEGLPGVSVVDGNVVLDLEGDLG